MIILDARQRVNSLKITLEAYCHAGERKLWSDVSRGKMVLIQNVIQELYWGNDVPSFNGLAQSIVKFNQVHSRHGYYISRECVFPRHSVAFWIKMALIDSDAISSEGKENGHVAYVDTN